jgi:RNA polymerase sigma factor (sigma-70 family)
MNDQKLIELLQADKTDKAFYKLYFGYPKVEKLILSKGGNKEDAQDVFQEALIVLYRKVNTSNFKLTSKLSTYLYSVCRFLWKDELIKSKRIGFADFEVELINESELDETIEHEKKLKQVEAILSTISVKCQEILQLFYFKKYSMKEIAKQMGYTSERIARTQKYKCMEKAKSQITL